MRVNTLRRSWGAVGCAQARVPRPYKEVCISRNIKDFEMEQRALKFSFNLGQSSFHGGRPSPTSPRGHRNKKLKFAPSFEGKYCNISESIHFFDFRPRAKCVRLLFYPLDFPFESTLVNWEVMSSSLGYAGMKIFVFLGTSPTCKKIKLDAGTQLGP